MLHQFLLTACAGLGVAAGTAAVLDISYIKQFIHHDESSSTSQLIKGRSRDLQKLLSYLKEEQLLCLIYWCAIIRWYAASYFCLILKKINCCCVVVIYPIITSSIFFTSISFPLSF